MTNRLKAAGMFRKPNGALLKKVKQSFTRNESGVSSTDFHNWYVKESISQFQASIKL